MNSIAFRIKILKESIAQALQASQREDNAIHLIAVSKTREVNELEAAYDAGIQHFGENRLQEALPKLDALADKSITWHFIGRIQTNKIKKIVQHFQWVHTVTNTRTAEKINHYHANPNQPINICIQVNIDADPKKAGIAPTEVKQLADAISQLPNLKLRGLMTVPEKHTTIDEDRKSYHQMKQLFNELNQAGYPLDTLSMGMSGDYQVAIEEGATHIRIGKNLFGPFDD